MRPLSVPDLEKESRDLAEAEQHIAEGETRITMQAALVAQLARDGHDVSEAEALLASFRVTLEVWRYHRMQILQQLKREETP